VAGVGGDDVLGQGVVLVQLAQQRREPEYFAGFRADRPLGEHDAGAVGDRGQQVRDQAVVCGRAAYRLAPTAISSARTSPAAAGTGMRDWSRNGASRGGKESRQSLVLAGTLLRPAQRHAPRPHRDAIATNPVTPPVTVRTRPPRSRDPACPATLLRTVTETRRQRLHAASAGTSRLPGAITPGDPA
jgi:hypothetical protein